MNRQLSLFNTNATTENVYRAGDWVQLKRKSKNAAYLKRGDIVQVEAVHPVNGSVKFWNEHTQRWDFLYPEEIKLTVEPVVGEIPEVTVEPVVGEIPEVTVEPVVGEIPEVIVESVVGEIPEVIVESVVEEIPEVIVESVVGEIPEVIVESVVGEIPKVIVESVVGEIPKVIVESVVGEIPELKVESVVGEIEVKQEIKQEVKPIVESVFGEIKNPKNYWNYDERYSGNGWLESHYKIRVDGKQRSIKCPEIGCTGPYYSYRWIEGKRQRASYTPTNKCPGVRKALAMGQPISEILKIISSQ